MALEIERKFLVVAPGWRSDDAIPYRQGYLSRDAERTVRIRIGGGTAYLVVKGPADGLVRHEFEYAVPESDARQMLDMCLPHPVEKIRHRIPAGPHVWEVDEFQGSNAGLLVAEIELSDPEESFARPAWLGPEVTDDRRFANSNLARTPWTEWQDFSQLRAVLQPAFS